MVARAFNVQPLRLAHWTSLALIVLMLLASTARAVTVTNLNDAGPGSLRDAVANTPPGGAVDFAPGLSGTIALSSGEIAIAKSLTIDGTGASITVSGGGATRIFDVTDGATTLTVRNLALANGSANSGSQRGGAIATTGALVVDTVSFTGNRAVDGGGAIFVGRSAGTLGSATVRNSVFVGNSVTGTGGVGGGALLVAGDASVPSVASLVLQNSTVSGNSANASVGMAGGGIAIATASLDVISSTITANHAGDAGADVHQGTLANTVVTLRNAIVGAGVVDATVLDATDRDLYQPGGMGLTSAGHNVVQQRSGAVFDATDAPNGTDPQLMALSNNGGPTLTHALSPTSPARDLVPLASCVDSVGAALTRDQRNAARGTGGNPCDAGAFEIQTIVVGPPTVPGAMAGVAYSQTFTTTGGVGAITFTQGGTLPNGVTLDSTGVLSGTPTQVGSFSFTVTASDAFGASSIATPYTLTVGVGAPAKLAFVQQPGNTAAGSTIAPAVVVQVQDAFGNPLTGAVGAVTIGLGANPGGSALSGTLTQNLVGGSATFANLALDKAGTGYTLVASHAGVPSMTSTSFDVVAGAPAKLVFGQQPSTVGAGATIAPAVTVRIVDAGGNPTSSSANVTLALAANPSSATLSGTLTVAAVNGTATFANLSLDKLGNGYTLSASSAGVSGAASSPFNVVAGAPVQIVFVQQPSSSAPNAALAPPVTVRLLDASGNATSATAPVSISIGSNPGGGVLSGTTTVNAIGGIATFTTLSIDKPGTGYTLVATGAGLTAATSAPFDITNRILNVALPGGEQVTLAITGGGAACNFVSGAYVPLTGGAGSPPAGSAPSGYVFTYGLVSYTAATCTGAVTLTYAYPDVLPASTVLWKYGRTAATPTPHWYEMPATVSGNTIAVTITDGGLGDDDLTVNGTIVDPSGAGMLAAQATAAPIPAMGWPAMAILALLMTTIAWRARRSSARHW
ncbi:MAG TPA: choice-of-anchor U domain-containing protein [Casimicrobiaceae bacterium]